MSYKINPIGYVKSPIQSRHDAPKQESENAPQAVLEILPEFAPAMDGLKQGQTIRLVTWFDRAYRGTLECHPRGNSAVPMRGVFSTRSPDRPNPVGLHKVKIVEINENNITVDHLEAMDGTPIVDIKIAITKK